MNKKIKNKGGAPRKVTDEVLRKLENAFSIGANNSEACCNANLAESTFYDFLKENKWFSEKIFILKAKTPLKAKQIIHEGLENQDYNFALKYLKNVSSDEFSEKIKEDKKVEYDIKIQVEFVDP